MTVAPFSDVYYRDIRDIDLGQKVILPSLVASSSKLQDRLFEHDILARVDRLGLASPIRQHFRSRMRLFAATGHGIHPALGDSAPLLTVDTTLPPAAFRFASAQTLMRTYNCTTCQRPDTCVYPDTMALSLYSCYRRQVQGRVSSSATCCVTMYPPEQLAKGFE
ncbi:hypothetical protein RSAG8_03947, partial [Rhizoctonia solani AG-8 WAC10335]